MTRRIGSENSATRALILDATETLMVEEGYAAVSTRRVAAAAGLKPALIQYYFPTSDELLLSVYRRAAEQVFESLEEALASRYPLRSMWAFMANANRTALAVELLALANHRKVVRDELVRYTERSRERQIEALETVLGDALPGRARATAFFMVSTARTLVMEANVGIGLGHAEAVACIEQWLDELEPLDDAK